MTPLWIFICGAVVGTCAGLLIAGILGAAGHADHQTDIYEAYQAGLRARDK